MSDSINVERPSFAFGKFIGPSPGHLCPNSSTNLTSGLTGSGYQWQFSTDSINFTNISDNVNYTGTNEMILQLNNIPSNWYGYQYRCMVNGVNDSAIALKVENKWLGPYDAAWENANNWGCSTVADRNTDVIIANGTAFLNSNAACRRLQLNPGASFTVNAGYTLMVDH